MTARWRHGRPHAGWMAEDHVDGCRACPSSVHDDDHEALECAAGNPRYQCDDERRARREEIGWLVVVPLAILFALVVGVGVLVFHEEVRPWLMAIMRGGG